MDKLVAIQAMVERVMSPLYTNIFECMIFRYAGALVLARFTRLTGSVSGWLACVVAGHQCVRGGG
jgi:hypothetical protein